MKKCFKCGKEKELSEFYAHKAMSDGHLGKCKECSKKDVRRNYFQNHDHYIEYERSRLDNPKRVEARNQHSRWLRKNRPEVVKGYRSKYSKVKTLASRALNNALRSGRVEKKPCVVCGNIKSEGHHEDYNTWYDVIWLCRKHHGFVHRFSGDERKSIIESIRCKTFPEQKAS